MILYIGDREIRFILVGEMRHYALISEIIFSQETSIEMSLLRTQKYYVQTTLLFLYKL